MIMKIFKVLWVCSLPLTVAAQSKFTNKVYGISLDYPQNYKLHRGDLGENYSLGYLGQIPMEFGAPGDERIATIEVPAELYPNTDLDTAFATVSVNRYLTREECEGSPSDPPDPKKEVAMEVSGLKFRGIQEGNAGLGHQFGGTYYHAFSEGTCYELGEGIATSGYGAIDGLEKLDGEKVAAKLDKILRSVTIDILPKVAPAPSASIRSFTLAKLPDDVTEPHYRLSWNVSGAPPDQVWLSTDCSGGVSLLQISPAVPEGAPFLCDVLRPTVSASGSLDLAFQNSSGGAVERNFRLFAKAGSSASKNVTVNLPALPVLISIGRAKVDSGLQESPPAQLIAGREEQLSGVAFLAHQSLWIGSMKLPVESADGRNISFVVPESLPIGQYSLYITNERGRSNVATVRVVRWPLQP